MVRSTIAAVGGVLLGMLLATATPAAADQIFWTNWLAGDSCAGACFTGNGTITTTTSSVGVTYHNDAGIGFYNTGAAGETDYWVQRPTFTRIPATSPYTSTAVDNIPTGTDMIALQFQGAQTLTFSEAIANPVFAFVSLNFNGYSFLNQDFEILSVGGVDGNDCGYWGCGGVIKNVVPLGGGNVQYQLNASNAGGTEPHGVIRFLGAFSTLTWTSASNEFWNGFTVGVQGTADEVFPETTGTTTSGTTTSGTTTTGAVPEPASLALLALALGAAARQARRRPRTER